MDEFSVIVEGIGNKIKRLIIRNKQLKDRIFQADEEKMVLQEKISRQAEHIKQLEGDLSELQASKVLKSINPIHARQKLNELLREIEKCQALLNR